MSIKIKVHILTNFKDGPWGGGNQFLKALKKEFIQLKCYVDDPQFADAIIFNSHHLAKNVIKVKNNLSSKIFIHRIDGPMSLYNISTDKRDNIVYYLNKHIADGTIYQSRWSKKENTKLGLEKTYFNKVISNAPDSKIFHKSKIKLNNDSKIKIIATSWSSNRNKGFEIYKFLDDNLDWSKYKMTFVGNTPIKFNNIKHISPLPSELLSKELNRHQIFITATKADPCSNSLIEALNCGLPAVALNDGGHPELIKDGGELFQGKKDVLQRIDMISQNIDYYREKIIVKSINEICKSYLDLIGKINYERNEWDYKIKSLKLKNILQIYLKYYVV